MTYLPRASITLVPGGMLSSYRLPLDLILPPSIQIDCPSIGFSAMPSMIVAFEMINDICISVFHLFTENALDRKRCLRKASPVVGLRKKSLTMKFPIVTSAHA